MIKRRRSGPLLPYANIRPTKQPSSTTVAVRRYVQLGHACCKHARPNCPLGSSKQRRVMCRLLMTTSVILVCLVSGHALFGVSSVPVQEGHRANSDTVLAQHLQLRERSARGLTEQGRQRCDAGPMFVCASACIFKTRSATCRHNSGGKHEPTASRLTCESSIWSKLPWRKLRRSHLQS